MKLVLAIFFIGISFASCTKNKEEEILVLNDTNIYDYRNNFTGLYTCFRLCTFWTISQPQVDTLFNGTINLQVIKSPVNADEIIIGTDTIRIDSSGSYTGFYDPPAYKNYSVSFRNDSIFLSTFSGGLGGGTTCSTRGRM